MRDRSAGDLLHQEIYPALDAVAAGLLDHLDPKASGGRVRYYALTCPACEHRRRAYYYPGSPFISCNRRDKCGQPTTVWDALAVNAGGSNRDILATLAEAAGVQLGGAKGRAAGQPAQEARDLRRALETVLRDCLQADGRARAYLRDARGFTDDDIARAPFGYYPDWKTVEQAVRDRGADPQKLIDLNILPDVDERASKRSWLLDGRITVVWPGPNVKFALCGRATRDDAPGPKYYFTRDADLSIPWGFTPGGHMRWAVEGFMDAYSLECMGVPAMATGGATLNNNQITTLAEAGIEEIGFVTDAGNAGIAGARQLIKRAEPLGVSTLIASIPQDEDDPDAMRSTGRHDEFRAVLARAQTGGAYAARLLLAAYHKSPSQRPLFVRQARELRTELTPCSRSDFDMLFRNYGVELHPSPGDPPRLFAALVDAGMDNAAARQRVRALTGHDIAVATPDSLEVEPGA